MSEEKRRASVKSQSYFRFSEITDKYTIGDVIGTGNYAEVRLGVEKQTGEKFAIKIIPTTTTTLDDILKEVDILARVEDHPNIVQLKEIYEKEGKMFVVMELVTGGELFDRIIQRQFYSEDDAREIIDVIIQTVSHMHSYGIAHRDLKPENILFLNSDPDSPIKIADFGLAKIYQPLDDSDPLKTLCGTPGYVAPEVLQNRDGYTPQCDLWSVGVLLYILLCGYPPFQNENRNKLFKQILRADFQFHSPWWDKVSEEAKDLISKLLVVDPAKRLDPRGASQHPWMLKKKNKSSELDGYVQKLHKKQFRVMTNSLIFANSLKNNA